MNKRPAISVFQLAIMTAGSAIMFPYTFMPMLQEPPANQDTWLLVFTALPFIFIIALPLLILINKFRGLPLFQISEVIMGKIGGKIISAFYAFLAFFCYMACMLFTVYYINIFVLNNTPQWALLLFMVIPITYTATRGPGVIARVAKVFTLFIILTIMFFAVVSIKEMDLDLIKPILRDSTLWEFTQGSFFTAARYSEILIIAVFSYYLKKSGSINSAYWIAIAIYVVSILAMTLPTLLILGPDYAKIADNPYYIFTRQASGEDIIQRLQSFNVVAWFTGTICKLTIYNYIAGHMIHGIVRKKDYRIYVLIVSIITFALCAIPILKKISYLHLLSDDKIFPWIVLISETAASIVLLIVYLIRKKKLDQKIPQLVSEWQSQEDN